MAHATIPPAGPDRMASLPRNALEEVSPPLLWEEDVDESQPIHFYFFFGGG